MQNFVGQQIVKRDTVVQIARTNQGIVKRVGVVLGIVPQDDQTSLLRVGWYDPDEKIGGATESTVKIDNLVKIDPETLPVIPRRVLDFVKQRGRARL